MNRKYNEEHIAFIRENIAGRPFKELTGMFNKRFGMSLGVSALVSLADRHGLRNGRDTRILPNGKLLGLETQFKKGSIPWNKGKKGINTGGEQTQFKKGNKPWNYQPVGTERINGDGYVDIKVADPNKWRGKHILIWEQHHGPISKGHVVIFADGNNRNFDPGNLLLVSRKQLVRMNQHGLIQNNAELTKTGVVVADIYNKIGEIKRNSQGGR